VEQLMHPRKGVQVEVVEVVEVVLRDRVAEQLAVVVQEVQVEVPVVVVQVQMEEMVIV